MCHRVVQEGLRAGQALLPEAAQANLTKKDRKKCTLQRLPLCECVAVPPSGTKKWAAREAPEGVCCVGDVGISRPYSHLQHTASGHRCCQGSSIMESQFTQAAPNKAQESLS